MYKFRIQISANGGSTYQTAFQGFSSGTTTGLENYNFPDIQANIVKVQVYGNTENNNAAIAEVVVRSDSGSPPPDTTPPSQVLGLNALAVSSSEIDLSWTANGAPDLDHYNVYSGSTAGFAVNTATDNPLAQPIANSYQNTGLPDSTAFYYRVAAVDAAGNIGELSDEVSATTLSPPEPDTTPPAVSVSHGPANPSSAHSVTYTASATDNAGLSAIEIFVDGISVGSCQVNGLSAGCVLSGGPYLAESVHAYYAIATDAAGQIAQSSPDGTFSVSSPPPAGELPTAQEIYSSETFSVPSSVKTVVVPLVNEFHENWSGDSRYWLSSQGEEKHKLIDDMGYLIPSNLVIGKDTSIVFHHEDYPYDAIYYHKLVIKRASDNAVVAETPIMGFPHPTRNAGYPTSSPEIFLPVGEYYVESYRSGDPAKLEDIKPLSISVLDMPSPTTQTIVGGFFTPTSDVTTPLDNDGVSHPGKLSYFQTAFPQRGLEIVSTFDFTYDTCALYGKHCPQGHLPDNKSKNHTLIVWRSDNQLGAVISAMDSNAYDNPYT